MAPHDRGKIDQDQSQGARHKAVTAERTRPASRPRRLGRWTGGILGWGAAGLVRLLEFTDDTSAA